MDDFASAIAYEVKQEIAERYFGFRSDIEFEIKEYKNRLEETHQIIVESILPDLCRMQFLLQMPRLFCSFLDLTRLPREYIHELCTRNNKKETSTLFLSLQGKGFTRWRRFRSLAILIYTSLAETISAYHETFIKLQNVQIAISEDIDRFEAQNDINEIFSFLRSLDSLDSDQLKFPQSNTGIDQSASMRQALLIAHPPAVEASLPRLEELPPLQKVLPLLTQLLREAYSEFACPPGTILPF